MTVTGELPGDDTQAPVGEWLGLPAAMARLGISERTLRRQLAAGKFQQRRRLDGRIEVLIPQAGRQASPGNAPDIDTQAEQLERGLALVDRFNTAIAEQLSTLAGQLNEAGRRLEMTNQRIAELSEENGYLRAKLEDAERRLSVPGNAPDSASQSATTETMPEPDRRPWWRFWE
jgi:hypothetical protein